MLCDDLDGMGAGFGGERLMREERCVCVCVCVCVYIYILTADSHCCTAETITTL